VARAATYAVAEAHSCRGVCGVVAGAVWAAIDPGGSTCPSLYRGAPTPVADTASVSFDVAAEPDDRPASRASSRSGAGAKLVRRSSGEIVWDINGSDGPDDPDD
jgi:hypothetical protein